MTRLLVLLLCLLPLATPAAGQGAAKKLKAATTAALKDYKATSKDVYALLDLQLQLIEKELAIAGALEPELRADLFDAIGEFQDGMWLATSAARGALVAAGQDALSDFAGGGALDGEFPAGFHPGDGGQLDRFRTSRAKADARQYAKAAARLQKTAKHLEKEAGLTLTVILLPIAPAPADVFDEGGSGTLYTPACADALAAVGAPGADDGVLFAAGMRYGTNAVTVSFTAPGEIVGSDQLVDEDGSERWRLVNDGGGVGLPPGHWQVGARLQGDGATCTRVIGVR